MNYVVYIVSLLTALERYIPYMSEEELTGIVFDGDTPDTLTISLWEYRKFCHDEELEARFREAYARQK